MEFLDNVGRNRLGDALARSIDEPALRDAKKIKIGCAKKHFEALDLGNDFHYNVRTTYQYEAVKA